MQVILDIVEYVDCTKQVTLIYCGSPTLISEHHAIATATNDTASGPLADWDEKGWTGSLTIQGGSITSNTVGAVRLGGSGNVDITGGTIYASLSDKQAITVYNNSEINLTIGGNAIIAGGSYSLDSKGNTSNVSRGSVVSLTTSSNVGEMTVTIKDSARIMVGPYSSNVITANGSSIYSRTITLEGNCSLYQVPRSDGGHSDFIQSNPTVQRSHYITINTDGELYGYSNTDGFFSYNSNIDMNLTIEKCHIASYSKYLMYDLYCNGTREDKIYYYMDPDDPQKTIAVQVSNCYTHNVGV